MSSPSPTQQAAFLKTSGRLPIFETVSISLPEVGPLELLVRLSATGVCGTDYGLASGHLGPTTFILGHEGVGRIFAIGSAVSTSAFPIGMRVGLPWIREVCGECVPCRAPGGETRCRAQKQSGWKVNDTFCQYAVIPMSYVVELPEDIPDRLVAPILCGGVTAYKSLKICGALPGEWIAVSGAGGGVGSLAIMYGRAMGYRVVALDVGDAKKEDSLEAGAERYIDVSADGPIEERIQAITGEGVKAVIVTAPSAAAYQSAVGLLAPFGTLLIDKDLRLIGSVVGTRGEILDALQFVRRGVVVPKTEAAELSDLTAIAAKYASGQLHPERRKDNFLATKFGIKGSGKGIEGIEGISVDSSRENCKSSLETSLKRLGVDCIDLFYMHRADPLVPIKKTVQAMCELQQAGKIKYLGLSEVSSSTLRKYWSKDDVEPGDFRNIMDRHQDENLRKHLAIVDTLNAIAKRNGCTLGQLVLAWIVAQWEKVIVIPGTLRIKYLQENFGAAKVHVTPDEERELPELVSRNGISGSRNPFFGQFMDTAPF